MTTTVHERTPRIKRDRRDRNDIFVGVMDHCFKGRIRVKVVPFGKAIIFMLSNKETCANMQIINTARCTPRRGVPPALRKAE